jgi:hypothetical protein
VEIAMSEIRLVPTSKHSATVPEIVLRENSTRRIFFQPLVVDNPHEPAAAVKGKLVVHAKKRSGDWPTSKDLDVARLRDGDWVEVQLDSSEVRALYEQLGRLYDVHSSFGIPRSPTAFVGVPPGRAEQVLNIFRGFTASDLSSVARLFSELGEDALEVVHAAAGLARMKSLLNVWRRNQSNSVEEFWQKVFEEHFYALGQVLAYDTVLCSGKAYVGGKTYRNTGGNVVDFLAQNPITRNAVLIEIKTPATQLLSGRYRSDVFRPSDELTGAKQQVLNSRYTLCKEVNSLCREDGPKTFDPECLVVAGHAGEELRSEAQQRAFELFRGDSKNVVIITYDELFGKLERLVAHLEGRMERDQRAA